MPLVQEITVTEELINGSNLEITSSKIMLGVATKINWASVTTEAKSSSAVILSESFYSG